MKNRLQYAVLLCSLCWLVAACTDDPFDSGEEGGTELLNYSFRLSFPENIAYVEDIEKLGVWVTNRHFNETNLIFPDKEGLVSYTGFPGMYDISLRGDTAGYGLITTIATEVFNPATGKSDTITTDSIVHTKGLFFGGGTNVKLYEKNKTYSLQGVPTIPPSGWVIKEMYTASYRSPDPGAVGVRFDQFIEIYNNTDSVLYADFLSIGETRAVSTKMNLNNYRGDQESRSFLWTVYRIETDREGNPATGRSVPVEPGKSIVIAPQPIDHARINGSPVDLRHPVTDYQWYDAYAANPAFAIDVIEVPNLQRYYSYSLSVWIVSVQLNRGFVLFSIPETMDMARFIDSHTDWRPNWVGNVLKTIAVPNEYILDAVDLSDPLSFAGKTLGQNIDAVWTYSEASYSGKSIRRKIERVSADGRVVYKDTNNSREDFWREKNPKPKSFPTNSEFHGDE